MDIIKSVVIPISLFLFAELAAAIWWASSTNTKVNDTMNKVDQVQQNQLEIREMRVEQKHMMKDQQRTIEMIDNNEKILKQLLLEMRQMRAE